jgi:hypothetical protein
MEQHFKDFLRVIDEARIPDQTHSKTLLRWFLFNVFRLDEIPCVDAMCDKANDKGIDGIWVDEDSEEIFLFQSVYTDKQEKGLGDKEPKIFVASAEWFSTPENIPTLMASHANEELKKLVLKLEIEEKLQSGYPVKLVFITTRVRDHNTEDYLKVVNAKGAKLDIWDRERLLGQFGDLSRNTRVNGEHVFQSRLPGFDSQIVKGVRMHVRPVRASDIAAMNGISDRRLFSLNVRFGLGRTRVNRDLEKAVRDKEQHSRFIIFHNGVTIICKSLDARNDRISIIDYSIVNGCQSAVTFFDNSEYLSDELMIIAKFIEVGSDDALAEDITYRSNNQNGINLRDLRSNDRIQLMLRKQFLERFGGDPEYLIKEGDEGKAREVIYNDRAAQWLMAVYLQEPYGTHQKSKLFGSDYSRVFRHGITPEKIYLAYLLSLSADSAVVKVDDGAIRTYQLTRFILMGIIADILDGDVIGSKLLSEPEQYLPVRRKQVEAALHTFAQLLIPDLNFYITERQQAEDYFDYKNAFKNRDEYVKMLADVKKSYQKAIIKHPDEKFEAIFLDFQNKPDPKHINF